MSVSINLGSLMSIKDQQGFSIIEVITAIAIFVIISSGAVISVISSFSTTRLAKEQQVATSIANEGIAATSSIRNQDWNNLSIGTFGLAQQANIWTFSGSNDLDSSGKYSRSITIEAVNRDSNEDIVSSGGIIDPNTLLVTSDVTWFFTPSRANTVSISQYLTNWQQAKESGSGITPTPTPTPAPTTCTDVCINLGYITGTCRQNEIQCGGAGETYEITGDLYCTGGSNADTCCCGN